MDTLVRKKAGLIICILFVIATTLCGCTVVDRVISGFNREKEIKTTAQQVMQCIVDKNKTKLLTLYSPDQINNHEQEILSQFDSAFASINGKIISYEYAGKGGGSESVNYGKVDFLHCLPEFRHVITDTGFEYIIEISFYPIWAEKPEREGISRIRIIEAEDYKNYVEIGFEYLDD